MRITQIEVVAFDAGDALAHVSTRWSELAARHNVLRLAVPPREMVALRIVADSGVQGCAVLAMPKLAPGDVAAQVRSVLLGDDPLYRERAWRRMREANVSWRVLSAVDIALWDLAGKAAGMPAWQLAGGCRNRVKVYVASHPDFGTPDDYAAHALACKRRGYQGYKVHGYLGYDPVRQENIRPSTQAFPEHDIEICRAIRAAVGGDFPLMHDPAGAKMGSGTFTPADRVSGARCHRVRACTRRQSMSCSCH